MLKSGIGLALASLLIIATRWSLVPKQHLYHIDNVNFALALDHFNPALDQPQPPGDPMYVALTKLLRVFVPRPEILFPLSGIIGSILAIIMLWRLGSLMFGERAGIAAALLLTLNPIFWLAGVGNYVRVYLALGAAAVAWFCWKSLTAPEGKKAHYARLAAIALGFFAGFRPEMDLLLLPLLAMCVWSLRPRWREAAISVFLLAAATLPWLLVTAAKTGGLLALYHLNSVYLANHSRHYSLFYGATPREAARIAIRSFYWSALGAVSWAAFVPAAWGFLKPRSLEWRFLAMWFFPPFLFHTFVHINNPDHALIEISAVCLAGGWVISRLSQRWFAPAFAIAAALNVLLFFYPTRDPYRTSNYRMAQYTIQVSNQSYALLAKLHAEGPVTVFWKDGFVTPQEISYYFPEIPVMLIDDSGAVGLRSHNRMQAPPVSGGEVLLAPGTALWMAPDTASEKDFFEALGPETQPQRLYAARLEPGRHFTIGKAHFAVAEHSRIAAGR